MCSRVGYRGGGRGRRGGGVEAVSGGGRAPVGVIRIRHVYSRGVVVKPVDGGGRGGDRGARAGAVRARDGKRRAWNVGRRSGAPSDWSGPGGGSGRVGRGTRGLGPCFLADELIRQPARMLWRSEATGWADKFEA